MMIIPIGVWVLNTGDIQDYLHPGVPDGQLLYVVSKLAGLVALSMIVAQISLISAKHFISEKSIFNWRISSHQALGIITLGLATLHVGLFFAAASARSGHVAWGLLTPRFSNGFYDFMVSIGLIGLCVLWIAGYLGRHVMKSVKFKPYHQLSVTISTLAVIAHSFAIGSETHTIPVRLFYVLLICILFWSLYSLIRDSYGRQVKT